MSQIGIIERAYQLAPECASLVELERRLAKEGYSNISAYLSGKQIRREINDRLHPERKKAFYDRYKQMAAKRPS